MNLLHGESYGVDWVYPVDPRHATFEAAARPLIKWLCENGHPHHTIIVTPTNAELLEGEITTGQVLDYLQD